MSPVEFSAIVIARNEARHLDDCLSRLSFCDEVLVLDLQSTDETPTIARAHGARVITREPVPIAEPLRRESLRLARNDWVVYCDPDEILGPGVGDALRAAIDSDPEVGVIALPVRYHFFGRPLTCTAWGAMVTKRCVVHRDRAEVPVRVHAVNRPRAGYTTRWIEDEALTTEHRWVDSFAQMLEKHRRYLRHEGEARHARGDRYTTRAAARDVAASLKRNLWNHRGLRGGPTGWLLSGFHAWYTAMCWVSLRRYERSAERG